MKKYSRKIFLSALSLILVLTFILSLTVCAAAQDDEDYSGVKAPRVFVAEATTDTVIYQRAAEDKSYPASTTKILTALVTAENIDKTREVTVSSDVLGIYPEGYVTAGLTDGEKVTVDELLHLMLIPSANDAAVILAKAVGGSVDKFVAQMNEKAKELGCKGSHFTTPYGKYDENHYTTAHDLYKIAKAFSENEYLMSIVKNDSYTLPATNKSSAERSFQSTNLLLDSGSEYYYRYAEGLKTGYTEESGHCLVSCAKEFGGVYISVVMGSEHDGSVFSDSGSILEEALKDYDIKTLAKKGELATTVGMDAKGEKTLYALYGQTLTLPVQAGDKTTPEITLDIGSDSVKKGQKIGSAVFTVNGKKISVPLLAQDDLNFKNYTAVIVLICAAVTVLILLVLLFITRKNYTKARMVNKKLKNIIRAGAKSADKM